MCSAVFKTRKEEDFRKILEGSYAEISVTESYVEKDSADFLYSIYFFPVMNTIFNISIP